MKMITSLINGAEINNLLAIIIVIMIIIIIIIRGLFWITKQKLTNYNASAHKSNPACALVRHLIGDRRKKYKRLCTSDGGKLSPR